MNSMLDFLKSGKSKKKKEPEKGETKKHEKGESKPFEKKESKEGY